MTQTTYEVNVIGEVISPFKEKFGLPRQPGLIPSLSTQILIHEPYARLEAFEGLNDTSHIWVQGIFHTNVDRQWNALVRPPRLGGNKKRGVFATRSPFRPSALSLSLVELLTITETPSGSIILETSCIDMIHGSPIVDIKPYIPYTDVQSEAFSDFADQAPQAKFTVEFDDNISETVALISKEIEEPKLKEIVIELLSQDPRPAYHGHEPEREYKLKLYDFDLHFRIDDQRRTCTIIRLLTGNP